MPLTQQQQAALDLLFTQAIPLDELNAIFEPLTTLCTNKDFNPLPMISNQVRNDERKKNCVIFQKREIHSLNK
jgi:hypothetical protein